MAVTVIAIFCFCGYYIKKIVLNDLNTDVINQIGEGKIKIMKLEFSESVTSAKGAGGTNEKPRKRVVYLFVYLLHYQLMFLSEMDYSPNGRKLWARSPFKSNSY